MQLAYDEVQVLAAVGVKKLGAMGYEYASIKSFRVALLPVLLTIDQATAQIAVHGHNVIVGLLERKKNYVKLTLEKRKNVLNALNTKNDENSYDLSKSEE